MSSASVPSPAGERTYDKLRVLTFADQPSLATAAANDAAAIITAAIAEKGEANVMVATGNAALRISATEGVGRGVDRHVAQTEGI